MNDTVQHIRLPLPARCDAEMARLGLSQTAAARRIGVSGSALNQWLKGTYKGNAPSIDAKVQRWLATAHDAETLSVAAAPVDRHVELDVSEAIMAGLAYAQATGDIVTVIGASGTGKTWALRHHCTNRSGTHYVSVRRTMQSLPGLFGAVGKVVLGPRSYRSALEAEEEIIAALRDRTALLVIDEAQFLSPMLLDALRCIRDAAECGLALAGDPRLEMRLGRCPQIVGRTGMRIARDRPAIEDVEVLVSEFLGRPAKRGEVEVVSAAAFGPGGLHALRRVLLRAWRLAQIEGREAATPVDLEQAALMIADAGGAGDAREVAA